MSNLPTDISDLDPNHTAGHNATNTQVNTNSKVATVQLIDHTSGGVLTIDADNGYNVRVTVSSTISSVVVNNLPLGHNLNLYLEGTSVARIANLGNIKISSSNSLSSVQPISIDGYYHVRMARTLTGELWSPFGIKTFGALGVPAARINTGSLLIDVDALNVLKWGRDRTVADGQLALAGDKWNADDPTPGVGLLPGALTFDDVGTTIDSFTMEDGTTERLKLSFYNGLPVIDQATTYVEDGSYVYQPGVEYNTAINVDPSDGLVFDGTRGQYSYLEASKLVSVGPSSDTIVVAMSFVVQAWMYGAHWTTGPTELHAPGSGRTSPILLQLVDGNINVNASAETAPIAPTAPAIPANNELASIALPAVGEIFSFIFEFKVDPGGSGFMNFYSVDSVGNRTVVATRGSDWGWTFDNTDPTLNDQFYLQGMQHYTFHAFPAPGTVNNWDASTADGNVQRLRTMHFTAAQNAVLTLDEWSGHIRWFLDDDNRYTLLYSTDWSDPNVLDDWQLYDSVGNAGWGLRRPHTVSVEDVPVEGKVLTIEAYQGTTGDEVGLLVHGGLKLRDGSSSWAFQYGRLKVRARVDKDPSDATSGICLLWPQTDITGFEVNIFENYGNRVTRIPTESHLHWGNGTPQRERLHVGNDTSDWHDYVMVWEPNLVAVSVDGGVPQVLGTDSSTPEVPDELMEAVLQLDAWDTTANPGVQPVLSQNVKLECSSLSIEVRT